MTAKEIEDIRTQIHEQVNFHQKAGETAPLQDSGSSISQMIEFVAFITDLTDDYHLSGERLERKAKSWLKLLGPGLFREELPYVVRVACLIRSDRRDSIKADEILRIAERVYGLPVNLWSNEAEQVNASPEVWSIADNDWISLNSALRKLFEARAHGDHTLKPKDEFIQLFNAAKPELCQLIYGGYYTQ